MNRRTLDDLGELQRVVMETVWDLGEATVQQVRERMKRRKKPAYTTILSVMQKLEKTGWLKHRADGRTYVYEAVATREAAGAHCLKSFVQRVFGGDALLLFQHLLEGRDVNKAELEQLREMIELRRTEIERQGRE